MSRDALTAMLICLGLVILVLGIVVLACCRERNAVVAKPETQALKESIQRVKTAQANLNRELIEFLGEEDKATGRKPLAERLKDR